MRAAVFNGQTIQIKKLEKPKPKDSQILIKVKAVGICGTDLAIARGYYRVTTPLILGHEFDFDCYFCNRELYTQCISRKAIGIDVDGAFADYIAVNEYLVHQIPDNLSYKEATFIEPLAAAYQTFKLMPIDEYDKNIAIFGLGKLGLLIAQIAKLKGLNLILVDGSDKKLELGRSYGAEHVINRLKIKDIPESIKSYTKGIGADIVVDATGNENALKDIIASCRTRGKIHIKSTHGLNVPLNITDIVVREITIYTSRCGSFKKAIEGLRSGKINVKSLISAEYDLMEIQKAFESYGIHRDDIKTIITI
ncbi:MAG: hypothetical protein EU541_04875 [Promethearchaeota archaeon]|nr:MAG: hypothetical protein EU541_04875 [Candidatus Lokiarchaeota archaeon]